MESNHRTQIRSLPLYPLSYGALSQSSRVETEAAARAWADGWARAWPAADADAVAALYADGAEFRSQPFRELDSPRAYAEWAFSEQDEAECWFGEPIVAGERAAVEWWGTWVEEDRRLTLAGATVLRFDADGLVVDHRDYWLQAEGGREPYPGWRS